MLKPPARGTFMTEQVYSKQELLCVELFRAAQENDYKKVSALLDNRAEEGFTQKVAEAFGQTPVQYAAEFGNLDALKAFRAHGFHPDTRLEGQDTPLQIACARGHHEIAEYLLGWGASVTEKGANGKTALHAAARNEEITDLILGAKPDINAQDDEGRTALHNAVSLGASGVTKKLLKAGANPNITTHIQNETPLHMVINKGCVQHLLAAGADPKHTSLRASTAARKRGLQSIAVELQGAEKRIHLRELF